MLRDINRTNLLVEGGGFVRMLAAETAISWGYVARDNLGRELFYDDALLARLGGGFARPRTGKVLNAPVTDRTYGTADDVFND